MTIEEKLQHFQEASLADARSRSHQMLEEHQTALEKIFADHQADSHKKSDLQIQTETDRLYRESNKTLSVEQVRIKREISNHRKELTDKLVVEVRDLLEEYMRSQNYEQLLVRQMKAAIAFSGNADMIIYIDPADAGRQQALEVATGMNVTVSSYSFMGGTRAVIPSRKILIDNSFETKLAEQREGFTLEGGNDHGSN